MRYPITLTPDDNHTMLVTSPDFPELTTYGDDEAEATLRAADALVTVIGDRIAMREAVPEPSEIAGAFVTLSLLESLKIALYVAMLQDGVGKAEMARRLQCHLPQIDRLLDLEHASKVDQLENAMRALGRAFSLSVRKAA